MHLRAEDFINFNPRESLSKGTLAKKISMERLQPFTRNISGYEVAAFNGGTKFRNGDTLMARITPCLENGKTAKVTVLNTDDIGFGSTEFIVLRAKPNVSDEDFVYYWSISPDIRDKAIKSMVGSSGRQRVQQSVLSNLELCIPPLPEQRAIAATLSCLDDKIELNNKINANLEAQAQTIFESWFVSPESNTWEFGLLSDLAYINPQRRLIKGEEATYVEMANLPTRGSFPINWINRPYSGGVKFCNGDTIMARITPCLENGKIAYINFLKPDEKAFGSTEYIVLSAKEGYPNEMLYFLARDSDFVKYAVKNMSGSSGRQRVSGDVIGNYEILLPPKDFVKKYSNYFVSTMEIIHKNSLQSRTLAALRDALLPKLMSGEIEVLIEQFQKERICFD